MRSLRINIRVSLRMHCDKCGQSKPTAHVTLMYNVGAIVVGFHGTQKGHFCRSCISITFWQYMAICLAVGWWGIFSFFVNWFALVVNITAFVQGLSLGNDPLTVGGQPVAALALATGPTNACPQCGPGTETVFALGRSRCVSCRTIF
jgi:hypothetical protein